MLDRLNPNGHRALIERNRTRPAEEIADAMLAKDARLLDSDDPGKLLCKADRLGLKWGEGNVLSDGREMGRRQMTPLDYEHPTFGFLDDHDDRVPDLTGRWWFPLAFVGVVLGAWALLKWMGVK